MAASVPIPGAIEGSWYKIDCSCWGLLPGWRQRQQQQLRQRQQRRRWCFAEILLFFLLWAVKLSGERTLSSRRSSFRFLG